jgi:predicted nucleic acid-binding protein
MKTKVYIETSFISYLAAKPSPNIVARARQEITRLWWQSKAASFDLVTSKLTEMECGRGDRTAAAKRIQFLAAMPILPMDESVDQLAQAFLVPGAIPEKATEDAVHLAICAIHTIPYLLTWNFRHLANARIQLRLEYICAEAGYRLPKICTPEQL